MLLERAGVGFTGRANLSRHVHASLGAFHALILNLCVELHPVRG